MGKRKMKGLFRLIAAATLTVLLFPSMLRIYLALSGDATANEVWMALVQAAPFGDKIGTLVLSLWEEAQSGSESLLDWLLVQDLDFLQYITVELGELVFTAVLLMLVSEVVRTVILRGTGTTIYDLLANGLFQTMCCLFASLLANLVFGYFSETLLTVSEVCRDVGIQLFALFTGAGSFTALVFSGLLFGSAALFLAVNCMKLLVSYGVFMLLLLMSMDGAADWQLAIGVVCWLILIGLLQTGEDLAQQGKRK